MELTMAENNDGGAVQYAVNLLRDEECHCRFCM